MFTIRLQTTIYRPDLQVTIRNNVDGWDQDIAGIYQGDEWRFELSEDDYPDGMEFKFVLERTYWMVDNDEALKPIAGGDYPYGSPPLTFPRSQRQSSRTHTSSKSFFNPTLMKLIFST